VSGVISVTWTYNASVAHKNAFSEYFFNRTEITNNCPSIPEIPMFLSHLVSIWWQIKDNWSELIIYAMQRCPKS
jgi:hypothetical protein